MGLFGAMTASVSGLNAQGQAISVISDNLANTNTVGYKSSRSLFSQLVTTSGVGGTSYNAGGTSGAVLRSQNTQGSLNSSSSATDLAISGNGFFRVSDSQTVGSSTAYYYTRAGSFSEDKAGYLVTPSGYYLQGWRTDSAGNITSVQNLVNIDLQSVGVSAQETTTVDIGANLNNDSTISSIYDTSTTLTANLDTVLANASVNGNYSIDLRLYDAQGGARDVSIVFNKRSANLWDWQMFTDGSNIQGGTAGTPTRIGAPGTLRFDVNGNLKFAEGATLTANWSSGVNPSTVTLNFGDFTGGKVVTAQPGLTYTDDVLDIAIEDEAFAIGTYTLNVTDVTAGVATVELRQGATVVGTTTVAAASGNSKELYFRDGSGDPVGVRVTLSAQFPTLTDPVLPATEVVLGTSFTVGSEDPLDVGKGSDGIVQFSSDNNTGFINQNGFGSGTLSSIQIDESGFVAGTFTNGETKKLFRVAMAVFQNPAGLETLSGSLLRVTDDSGQALIKTPGVSGTGRIVSGALEGSTTDIAGEFSNMIVAQRAFQASSKVITTVDQMLNELLQLR